MWLRSILDSSVDEKSFANLAVVMLASMLAKLRACADAFLRRQLRGRTDELVDDAEFCHSLVVHPVDDIPLALVRRPHCSGIRARRSDHVQPELSATASAAAARRDGILDRRLHGFAKPWGGNVSNNINCKFKQN